MDLSSYITSTLNCNINSDGNTHCGTDEVSNQHCEISLTVVLNVGIVKSQKSHAGRVKLSKSLVLLKGLKAHNLTVQFRQFGFNIVTQQCMI